MSVKAIGNTLCQCAIRHTYCPIDNAIRAHQIIHNINRGMAPRQCAKHVLQPRFQYTIQPEAVDTVAAHRSTSQHDIIINF